jgi:hypothetical protein
LPAATVGALGLVDIALGVVAPRSAPTIFWPLAALGATGTALVCGLALLLLARRLTRGLRVAWMLTLALLVPAARAAAVAHDDWAVPALVPAAVLYLHRRDVPVKARPPRRRTATAPCLTTQTTFGVRWETRYLVYAGDAAVPAALYAVVRAHLPSLCSVLEQRPPGRGRRRLSTRAQAA